MAKQNERELRRQKLRERQDRERRTSGNFKPYIEFPEEVPVWKPSKGDHVVNLIEFEMGDKDPALAKYDKGAKSKWVEGDLTYCLEVQVHKNIGPSKDSYVCLRQYGGLPCPICEHRDSLWDEDPDQAKKLYPSIRCIYNIWSMYPDEDQEKGVMVWDVAAVYMEDPVQALKNKPLRPQQMKIEGINPNPCIAHPSMEEGREVSFSIGEKKISINGKPVTVPDYAGHSLEIRDYDVPEEILDQAYHKLDQYLVISSYDEIYEAYYGEPKKGKKVVEEEQEEKKPFVRRGKQVEKEVVVDEEEDNDGEESFHEEVLNSGRIDKCPADRIFGLDCGKYAEDCDDCQVFEDCAIAKRTLKKDKVKEQKKEEEPKEEKKSVIIKRRR